MFVRCLLLSEKSCRLVQFDRSGAQVSPRFNIHTDYRVFIRLIVALTSPDERAIGFDDSIKWTINPVNGRKAAGTITCITGPKKKDKKVYRLINVEPIATHVIRGRATTCWSVLDPKTKRKYIIKDSWTFAGRTPEHELLKKATDLGLKGVAKYVWHETDRANTQDFRCQDSIRRSFFLNRVASRIVMEGYGKPVDCFTSILQLLSALHDAISGELYSVLSIL